MDSESGKPSVLVATFELLEWGLEVIELKEWDMVDRQD
jgi:hypothetical protein